MKKFNTVKEYFAALPAEKRKGMEAFRQIIKKAAPEAEEVISYLMPAFRLRGMLVWYAAQANHYGFYPSSTPIREFKDRLSPYKFSKGAIQFPLNKPLPKKLITDIVKFRVKENIRKESLKQVNKTNSKKKK